MRAGNDSQNAIWLGAAANAGGRRKLASMLAAAAQTPPADDEPETQEAEETEAAPSVNDVDIMKDIDVDKLDWSQLNVDASTLADLATKGGGASKGAASADASWSANERTNGTSAVSVKQSISPFWDTRIGADMTVARQGTATTSELLSEKLANGGSLPQSSGTAWAAITAPGVASIWDRGRGPRRSRIRAEQARHLPEQITAAQRAIFADPEERLQPDPAGHRAGARHR